MQTVSQKQAKAAPATSHLDSCSKWLAEIVSPDGSIRDSLEFYLHADDCENAARARAKCIWMLARNWPQSLRITKVRDALPASQGSISA